MVADNLFFNLKHWQWGSGCISMAEAFLRPWVQSLVLPKDSNNNEVFELVVDTSVHIPFILWGFYSVFGCFWFLSSRYKGLWRVFYLRNFLLSLGKVHLSKSLCLRWSFCLLPKLVSNPWVQMTFLPHPREFCVPLPPLILKDRLVSLHTGSLWLCTPAQDSEEDCV